MMNRSIALSALAILSVACAGEMTEAEVASETAEAVSELSIVECSPRDPASCERGESCLGVGAGPDLYVCAADRCRSSRECDDGYVCRVNHCLRVERDERDCPRGTVPGITACAEGYTSVVVSRRPLCSTCEPEPDRCAPGRRPTARGNCRQILGYYWNGRSCTPLSGCRVVSATGLFRTAAHCARAYHQCLPQRGR